MTEQEVVDLMRSSKSRAEWNANCDAVKKSFGGYPSFWFHSIVISGLFEEVTESFDSDGQAGEIVSST